MDAHLKVTTRWVCSFALALALSGAARAQEAGAAAPSAQTAPKPTIKVLGENEKLRVIDEVRRPGEASPMGTRPMRVIYVIDGGVLERRFADGTKEIHTLEKGHTEILTETRAYSVNNIGKTTIHLVEVALK